MQVAFRCVLFKLLTSAVNPKASQSAPERTGLSSSDGDSCVVLVSIRICSFRQITLITAEEKVVRTQPDSWNYGYLYPSTDLISKMFDPQEFRPVGFGQSDDGSQVGHMKLWEVYSFCSQLRKILGTFCIAPLHLQVWRSRDWLKCDAFLLFQFDS